MEELARRKRSELSEKMDALIEIPDPDHRLAQKHPIVTEPRHGLPRQEQSDCGNRMAANALNLELTPVDLDVAIISRLIDGSRPCREGRMMCLLASR